ncbi:hypothetical protein NKJ26_29895 [Mesorhizobium sp. M0152]
MQTTSITMRKADDRELPIGMFAHHAGNMVEGILLRADADRSRVRPETPLLVAAVNQSRRNLVAGWRRTGSKAKDFNGITWFCELKGVSQSDQDRIVGPKATIHEGMPALHFGIGQPGHRSKNWRRRGRHADVDKCVVVVTVLAVFKVRGFEDPRPVS